MSLFESCGVKQPQTKAATDRTPKKAASLDRVPSTRRCHHYNGLNGVVEHKSLLLMFRLTVGKQDVVVGYLSHVTFVYATGDAPDSHKLALVPAKQIFGVLSFHGDAPDLK